jgi:hypothetical protein
MSREFLAGSYDDMVAGISWMLTVGALLSSPAVVGRHHLFRLNGLKCVRARLVC